MPIGIALTNSVGEIIFGNEALTKMVRHPVLYSADADSYGEWEAYHADGRRVASHEYPLARILREGAGRTELDVHYVRGDKSRFWMRIIGDPVFDNEGHMVGAIVATVDIDAEVRLQTEQKLMIAELNHRVLNSFRVTQAIISQTLQAAGSDPGLVEKIDRRLKAYAAAHTKLGRDDWTHMTVGDVARDVITSLEDDRFMLGGPDLRIPPRMALSLSMAFYELATNAFQHGALRFEEGKVELTWGVDEQHAARWFVNWTERGGTIDAAKERSGFGTFILKRVIALETRGKVAIDYGENGLTWRLDLPAVEEAGFLD